MGLRDKRRVLEARSAAGGAEAAVVCLIVLAQQRHREQLQGKSLVMLHRWGGDAYCPCTVQYIQCCSSFLYARRTLPGNPSSLLTPHLLNAADLAWRCMGQTGGPIPPLLRLRLCPRAAVLRFSRRGLACCGLTPSSPAPLVVSICPYSCEAQTSCPDEVSGRRSP